MVHVDPVPVLTAAGGGFSEQSTPARANFSIPDVFISASGAVKVSSENFSSEKND